MANRPLLVIAGVLALATAGSSEAPYLEYDLDGLLGNGPDDIYVPVGTMVDVHVWIQPPLGGVVDNVVAFGTIMCNPDHSLAYVSCVYSLPSGWTGIAPQAPDGSNCITVQGVIFTGYPLMVLPWGVATVRYQAAVENSIGMLVSAAFSVTTTDFNEDSYVGSEIPLCSVHIGPTGTDVTSWGSIKGMFR